MMKRFGKIGCVLLLAGALLASGAASAQRKGAGKSGAKERHTEQPKRSVGSKVRPSGAPFEHRKQFDASKAYVKVALNAYSFAKPLNDYVKGRSSDPMTMFDLIDFCAENDIDALDATGYFLVGYPDIPTDEYLYLVKRYAFSRGVDICGTGTANNFADPDAAARAADLERVKRWVDVAAKLGAPVLRVFSGPVPEGYEARWDEVAGWMAECFREAADYGASRGVMIGVQNHGDMLATGEQTLRLLRLVDHPWFGLILDTGYFRSPDPYVDMEMCMPYAINFQVKESAFGKESFVEQDLGRIMRMVRKAGYRGYLPVETLSVPGRPYDPYTLVPEFVTKVRAAVAAEFDKEIK